MRILFLSPRLCLPLHTGARIREYYLARALAANADVTYVSFIQPGFSEPPAEELSFFSGVHLVPLTGRYSATKIAGGLLGGKPLSVLNYTTPEMKAVVAELGRRGEFDLVHVESCHMIEYLHVLERIWGHAPRAVHDWHNIESEVMYRYGKMINSFPRRIYANLTGRRLQALETWILRTGFGHVVCSAREEKQLRAIAPDARIAVVENGVDTERFSSDAPLLGVRRRLLYVGTMEYYPNIEAVTWFARRIWPGIRKQHPDWQLTIVGAKPTGAVLELRNEPNVEVTGTVPDVRLYYQEAIAAIVPLHTGGGTRLKILEAMASGVPVVSTTLGAEGLAATPHKDIEIVDDEAGWLGRLEALNADEPLRRERISAGLTLVRNSYNWSMLGEQLYHTYASWLERTRA